MGKRMIDLFCGRGGATKGFQAQGWECLGLDLNPQPDYPARFEQRDVLGVTADELRRFDFGWASSPCEEFSVHCMKHFHPNPKFPEMGIKLFEHTRNIFEQSGIKYVMENVRCAEKFVGKAVNHCGPFYLWGNGVPAIMPPSMYDATKAEGYKSKYRPTPEMIRRGLVSEMFHVRSSLPQKTRASIMAESPSLISNYIAATFLLREAQ